MIIVGHSPMLLTGTHVFKWMLDKLVLECFYRVPDTDSMPEKLANFPKKPFLDRLYRA